jgi:predicted alpha-1,2-mannosidase
MIFLSIWIGLITALGACDDSSNAASDDARRVDFEARQTDQESHDEDRTDDDEDVVRDEGVDDMGHQNLDDSEISPPLTSSPIESYDPIPLVDPFIATGGDVAEIASVSPGASAPLGLTLIGPDTRRGVMIPPYHCAGYHYPDTHIQGFSHTHAHGMGVVDYGGISVMPRAQWRDSYRTFIGRQAPFNHDHEWASPGRYGVQLQDDDTLVEIVATPHGAHHRYLFDTAADTDSSSGPVVILDLGDNLAETETLASSITAQGRDLSATQTLSGQYSTRFGGVRHHAALRFDPPPVEILGWVDDSVLTTGDGMGVWRGQHTGVVVRFAEGTTQVDLRVALSFVDLDGAWLNLEAELGDLDWDARLDDVEALWRTRLERVRVRGTTQDLKRFTTAHYHSLLMPSLHSDIDGRYRGLDQEIHLTDHPYYSDLSLWDTFRTLHSFYLLVHPHLQLDILKSLTRMSQDGGSLPRWPLAHGYTGGMVGTPAAQLFAEASLKGMSAGWDEDYAFEVTFAQVMGTAEYARRGGGAAYRTLGWVPADEYNGSVSRTLEFAWSDFSLALWAERLNRPEANELRALSSNWRNVWNADAGFMIGRRRDGTWVDTPPPFSWVPDYVEGNAWHYVWYVPYDVDGLIEVQHRGDRDQFLERYLNYWAEVYAEPDDLLPDDWYWHGNEPVMHYAWLGSLAGNHESTVLASHHILETRYGHTPSDGLDGNDDSGTLSAWYLWASMGLYPISGTQQYALGAPIFDRIEIDLTHIDETQDANDEISTLVIEAPRGGWYQTPLEVRMGDEVLMTPQISHEQLMRGLQLIYPQ